MQRHVCGTRDFNRRLLSGFSDSRIRILVDQPYFSRED